MKKTVKTLQLYLIGFDQGPPGEIHKNIPDVDMVWSLLEENSSPPVVIISS
jgi:hypothetical protein